MDVSRRISTQKREGLTTGVGDKAEVYNTGDLASEDELGRIHYHGRIDWQVESPGGCKKVFMDVL